MISGVGLAAYPGPLRAQDDGVLGPMRGLGGTGGSSSLGTFVLFALVAGFAASVAYNAAYTNTAREGG